MGHFEKIYRSDLNHRARAVYMYLKDRADSKRNLLARNQYHRGGAGLIPLHRQESTGGIMP